MATLAMSGSGQDRPGPSLATIRTKGKERNFNKFKPMLLIINAD